VLTVAVAAAQTQPRPGSLRLVVRDATDLAIPSATVTITGPSGVTRSVQANERGEATFDGLTPGEYAAHVESPGFTPADIKDLRVRAGAQSSSNVSLEIASLAEEVDVSPAADDAQLLDAFTTQLTPEQLAALPDDPEELAQVLQTLIGDDADVRVNGFAGGRLPQGTQIQEIRVRYDAASGSGTGGPRVEIRTRPGRGGWQNTFNMNMRDDSMNARNAFSEERPSGQTRHYAYTINGPLVRNRTGISLSIDRAETQEQQAIRAARPDGLFSTLVSQPSTRTGISMEIEHALTAAQELRLDVDVNSGESLNQGVSEFDLPERAYTRKLSDGEIRIGHRSTIRNRWVNNLRFQYEWQTAEAHSSSDAMTVRVLDAFTVGGAQIRGGRRTRDFNL
jgi:Carboxypeptidase regulatory-like domain